MQPRREEQRPRTTDWVRPVTISMIAATIITKGNERSSALLGRGRLRGLESPLDHHARAEEAPEDQRRG